MKAIIFNGTSINVNAAAIIIVMVCGHLFTGQPVAIKTKAHVYIDYIVKMSIL